MFQVLAIQSDAERVQEALASGEPCCFMGVSLMSTTFFSKRRIAEILRTTRQEWRYFILIIADSLEAVNHRYLRGAQPDDALRRALNTGEIYYRGYRKLSVPFPGLIPVRSSELEDLAPYQAIYRQVDQAFRMDSEFRSDVRSEVLANVGTLLSGDLLSRWDTADPTVEEYVLREVALSLYLLHLSQHGVTQISPHRGGVLAELEKYTRLWAGVDVKNRQYSYVTPTVEAWNRDAA